MAWNFQHTESKGFDTNLPEGNHRIRIASAEKAVSKNGKDMLTLKFDVSGSNESLYHYIVFLPDRPEITNRNLTQFFASFKDIPEGDFNMQNWIGKVGACATVHDEYNGNTKSKIKYFIAANKQTDLPGWVEPGNSATSAPAGGTDFLSIPAGVDAEMPF